VLLVADSVPFTGLPHLLRDVADDRVWTYAEWVGPEYAPRTGGDWTPGYHGARSLHLVLYNRPARLIHRV
jgi:hypothetical protein